jgi:hypothetical protein
MTFTLDSFLEFLFQVAEGTLCEAQALVWLDAAIAKVEGDYQGVQQLCESSDYELASPQEISHGLGALEGYRDALGLVEEYYAGATFERLEQAAELAVTAQQKMDLAMCENQRTSADICCDLSL